MCATVQFEVWDKEVSGNDKLLCGVATSFMGWIGKGSFEGDLVLKDEKVCVCVCVASRMCAGGARVCVCAATVPLGFTLGLAWVSLTHWTVALGWLHAGRGRGHVEGASHL